MGMTMGDGGQQGRAHPAQGWLNQLVKFSGCGMAAALQFLLFM